MERIQSINSERIIWCCVDYGITPGVLASELDIAATSMERVMTGKDGMTFNQLRKVAEYFGCGVLFLLDEAQGHTTQFRILANQKPELSPSLKKLIERVEKQRAVYLSLLEDLDETEQLRFNPPKLPHRDLREAARIARKWLGLAEENNFETYRLTVEAWGVLVHQKKQPWESQQSFTLMHELGHLLLHKASSIDDERDLQSFQGKVANVIPMPSRVICWYLMLFYRASRMQLVLTR